jgi:hypothetical protein
MGGIRPEFGTLFGPKKSVQAEEKLFARNSLSSDLSGSLGSLRWCAEFGNLGHIRRAGPQKSFPVRYSVDLAPG